MYNYTAPPTLFFLPSYSLTQLRRLSACSVKLVYRLGSSAVARRSFANHALAVFLGDLEAPAKLVLQLAELDALEVGEQLDTERAGFLIAIGDVRDGLLAVLGRHARVLRQQAAAPGDGPDGHEGSRGASCHDLLEVGKLTVLNLDGGISNIS